MWLESGIPSVVEEDKENSRHKHDAQGGLRIYTHIPNSSSIVLQMNRRLSIHRVGCRQAFRHGWFFHNNHMNMFVCSPSWRPAMDMAILNSNIQETHTTLIQNHGFWCPKPFTYSARESAFAYWVWAQVGIIVFLVFLVFLVSLVFLDLSETKL